MHPFVIWRFPSSFSAFLRSLRSFAVIPFTRAEDGSNRPTECLLIPLKNRCLPTLTKTFTSRSNNASPICWDG
jgi:hypothetical protein